MNWTSTKSAVAIKRCNPSINRAGSKSPAAAMALTNEHWVMGTIHLGQVYVILLDDAVAKNRLRTRCVGHQISNGRPSIIVSSHAHEGIQDCGAWSLKPKTSLMFTGCLGLASTVPGGGIQK